MSSFNLSNSVDIIANSILISSNNTLTNILDLITAAGVSSGYTTTQVDALIAGLVNSAPATLNTLNELAAALGNDANYSTTLATLVGTKANQATTYTIVAADNAITAANLLQDLAYYSTFATASGTTPFTGVLTLQSGLYLRPSTNPTIYPRINYHGNGFSIAQIGAGIVTESYVMYGATGDWFIRSSTSSGQVTIQDVGGNVVIGNSGSITYVNSDLNVAENIKTTLSTGYIRVQSAAGNFTVGTTLNNLVGIKTHLAGGNTQITGNLTVSGTMTCISGNITGTAIIDGTTMLRNALYFSPPGIPSIYPSLIYYNSGFSVSQIGGNANLISYIMDGAYGNWYIRSGSTSGHVTIQDTGGSVNIGSTGSSCLVNGNFNVTQAADINGALTVTGLTVLRSAIYFAPVNQTIYPTIDFHYNGIRLIQANNSSAVISSHILYGPSANWYIRSGSTTGNVIIQDTGGFITMGSANSSTQVYGNLSVSGTFSNPSDKSLKDDIKDIDENVCINILKSITSKSYIRNDLNDDKRRIGFISNEIQEVLTDDMQNITTEITINDDKIIGLDYGRLTAILWSVCKNQQSKLEDLEARLIALEQ